MPPPPATSTPSRAACILFDFNGVLVDDEGFHFRGFLEVFAPLGARFSRATYNARYLALDDLSAARAITRDFGLRTGVTELVARKRAAYIRLCGPSFGMKRGVVEMVRRLHGNGVQFGIVSGAARAEIEAVLRRARLRRLFHVVIAAEDVRRCKPSPEGYRRALRLMGAAARTTLAIEDSPGGIAAALAARLKVIGIATSYPAAVLRRAGAARVVRSLDRMRPEALVI